MKLINKLLIAAVVIGVSLPFTIFKSDDGSSLISVSDLKIPGFSMPDFSFLNNSGSGKPPKTRQPMSQVTIYKWTDAEGNPQFGSSPPAEGIEYTEKQYDPNENVIPAVATDSSNRRQESEPVLPRSNSEAVDFGDIFSPEVIVKLFEDANNVDKFSNNRTKTLNADPGQ
jgi:hypothetical protein